MTDGVLRVRPSSGTLWETDNTGANILVRPAPADPSSYEVEVIVIPATGAKEPGLYEQAGLVWYGGALGGAVAVLLSAWRRDFFGLHVLEVAAPGLLVIKQHRGGEHTKFANIAVLEADQVKIVDGKL